jgi:catechol 2,3-dioxygenase-like lactoylglutathione lyase family enzyme
MGHFGIHVEDVERSLKFYRDLLGFTQVGYFEEADPVVRGVTGYQDAELNTAILQVPNSDMFMEIIKYRQPQGVVIDPQPANVGTVHLAFFVDDLRATYGSLLAAGVRSAGEVTEIPPADVDARVPGRREWPTNLRRLIGGKSVYMIDPDGIRVELSEANQERKTNGPRSEERKG